MSYEAFGGAASLPWRIEKDGQFYAFPPTGNGNTLGPNSSSQDNIVAWNNGVGTLLKDSGVPHAAVAHGAVIMWPPTSGGAVDTNPFNVIVPPGAPALSCAGTHSQCLNEALAYVATNAPHSLILHGQSYSGTVEADGSLTSTVPIVVPPCSFCAIEIHNLLMKITAPDGLVIDSQEGGTFNYDSGVIFYVSTGGATGSAIHFNPVGAAPTDMTIGITISNFTFPPIAAPEVTTNTVINFDLAGGPISRNKFLFLGDVCGACNPMGFVSMAANGVTVKNAIPARAFANNDIAFAGMVHQFTTNGIQIGTADDFLHAYSNNHWDINAIDPVGATAVGFLTYGSGDVIRVGVVINDEGAFQHCVSFASANAFLNKLTMGCQGNSGTPIVDAAGGTGGATNEVWMTNNHGGTEAITVGPGRPFLKAALPLNQNVTSTVITRVDLVAVSDTNGYWDAINKVFHPLVAGTYEVCWGLGGTAAAFNGTTDNIQSFASKNALIDVRANGTFVQPAAGTSANSTSGCNIYPMNGTTDTLELDAKITATTPQVLGVAAGSSTYMVIHRVGP